MGVREGECAVRATDRSILATNLGHHSWGVGKVVSGEQLRKRAARLLARSSTSSAAERARGDGARKLHHRRGDLLR